MTDIVERLQHLASYGGDDEDHSAIQFEAADEIARLREHNAEHEARYDALEAKEQYHKREAERLRAENERLKAELRVAYRLPAEIDAALNKDG